MAVRRERYPTFFSNFCPSSVRHVYESGMIRILKHRDDGGRQIFVFRTGKTWKCFLGVYGTRMTWSDCRKKTWRENISLNTLSIRQMGSRISQHWWHSKSIFAILRGNALLRRDTTSWTRSYPRLWELWTEPYENLSSKPDSKGMQYVCCKFGMLWYLIYDITVISGWPLIYFFFGMSRTVFLLNTRQPMLSAIHTFSIFCLPWPNLSCHKNSRVG